MNSTDASPSPHPPDELVDLLREIFLEGLADPDGPPPSRVATARLAEAAACQGIRSAAQLLPAIRAAWSRLPAPASVPDERRGALLHRVTSAIIASLYENR